MHGSGDTIVQIVADYASNYIYWRSSNPTNVGGTGAWGSWRKIWHEGNDGDGSGLDADLLGGIAHDFFVRGKNSTGSRTAPISENVHDETQYKSGFWEVNGATWTPDNAWWWGITTAYASNNETGATYCGQIAFSSENGGNKVYVRTITGGVPKPWQKLWTTGNDGAGSGLDADLLGGVPSANYVHGTYPNCSRQTSATQNVYEEAQYKSGFWDAYGASWTPTTEYWWGITVAHTSNSSSYNYSGQLAFKNGGGGNNVYARTIVGGVPSAWSKLWSDGNDGAGSGLDADKIKGVNLTVSNTAPVSPNTYDIWIDTNS
jgi:hypothetical protein